LPHRLFELAPMGHRLAELHPVPKTPS
jgi:hypothetical protein